MAEPRSVLTAIDAIRQDEKGKIMTHFTLVCVLLDWRQGEGEPLEDAQQVKWLTLAEAEALDTFPMPCRDAAGAVQHEIANREDEWEA